MSVTRSTGLSLAALRREVPGLTLRSGSDTIVVDSVTQDSRRVEPGTLFVARRGRTTSGEDFVPSALARGASAVLTADSSALSGLPIPHLVASDVVGALAAASHAVFGHPSFSLELVGVTGTNGKTTVTHLVQAAIQAAGGQAGVVGTLGARLGDLVLPSAHTNPEADELCRVLAAFRSRGATHAALEVSSIGIAERRVEGLRFRVAAFTNLTQDHLDYHGTMEAYGEAKARLFLERGPGASAVMVDDPFGAELARRIEARFATHRLSRVSHQVGASADVVPEHCLLTPAGIEMRVRTPRGPVEFRSPLVGAHNAKNLVLAVAVAELLDLELAHVAAGLSAPVVVPGRMERCDDPRHDDVVVLVDYAHTPDALSRVLESTRAFTSGQVWCVFGCGGDRDPAKRPLMGEAVAAVAHRAVVTSDNPRSEDPAAIARAVWPGVESMGERAELELDRAVAIRRAVLGALPGDVVVVAGKGHETYQIAGGVTRPFDDRVEARAALSARRAASQGGAA
jgi:UDP-N-acetylmuramoyl-L-alanyl-D-glutamate--2,6-diaminopimelate ligase